MSDLICVTNRLLCREDFFSRIEKIVKAKPLALILREKDLPPAAYQDLAAAVIAVCRKYDTLCVLHHFTEAAKALGCPAIHLPMWRLRELSQKERDAFPILGASCHSPEEAKEAQTLGCTYLTAGHVFDTDCKKGLPGRGLSFLQQACAQVTVPVYAIGGIRPEHMAAVRRAGAAGACVMSGVMTCGDVDAYLQEFKEPENEI